VSNEGEKKIWIKRDPKTIEEICSWDYNLLVVSRPEKLGTNYSFKLDSLRKDKRVK